MDPREFCSRTRLVIVAGKGGVGKTTVTAALARMAARAGLSALVVELEGTRTVGRAFGVGELDYHERVVSPGSDEAAEVRGRAITPDEALVEYLDDHGLRRVSRRLVRTGAIDVVATAVPGIEDILVLGKVRQLEQAGVADVILLDAPAAGQAVTFLTSPGGLFDAVRGGPVRAQAEQVLEMLTDADRSQVVLVTLAEETPVNEVIETAYALEDRVGVKLGPVVVNGLYPLLDGLHVDPLDAARAADVALRPGEAEALGQAAHFRARRQELQQAQLARLAAGLPLPQLHAPYLFKVGLGPHDIDVVARALASEVQRLEVPRPRAGGTSR